MTLEEFNKLWNSYNGAEYAMAIIFDNNMTWVLNDREYRTTDDDGNLIVKDADRYGDFIRPGDYILIDQENAAIKRKVWHMGVTAEEAHSGQSIRYFWEVHPIENIQCIIFCDENNPDWRGYFDPNIM